MAHNHLLDSSINPDIKQSSNVPRSLTLSVVSNNKLIPVSIPNFNHCVIVPTVIDPKNMTLEEKESRRLAKQRERNNRYRDKTRPYIDLANAPTNKDKILGIFKLCYPQLDDVDSSILDQDIISIMQYMTRQRS